MIDSEWQGEASRGLDTPQRQLTIVAAVRR
jgi:hypothetical protein